MSPLVKYLLRNLASRPFISALVVGSMVIVGATIGGVGGVGAGLLDAFASKGHDNWVIVTSRGARNEMSSNVPSSAIGAVTIGAEVKRSSPEVVALNMVLRSTGGLDLVQLRGLDEQGFEMHGGQLIAGRMPKKGEPEVILGESLQQVMPWLVIGSTIKLVNTNFTCVGVFRSSGFLAGEAWTTRAAIQADPRRNPLSVVYLETANAADAHAVAARIQADRAQTLDASTEREFYDKMIGEHAHLVAGMLVIFVLVVGGSILAASSLLGLFQQRRLSELCVMRAMGFRWRVIASLILAETELLVLTGGVLGVLVSAFGLGHFVVHSVSQSGSTINFSPRLGLGLGLATIAVMGAVGVAGAIGPILRMIRTPITRGLREE